MAAKTKAERMKAKHARLIKLCEKACEARYKFEMELAKAQESKDWEDFCKITGVSPTAESGDWMS